MLFRYYPTNHRNGTGNGLHLTDITKQGLHFERQGKIFGLKAQARFLYLQCSFAAARILSKDASSPTFSITIHSSPCHWRLPAPQIRALCTTLRALQITFDWLIEGNLVAIWIPVWIWGSWIRILQSWVQIKDRNQPPTIVYQHVVST